jgi:NAD(P)-dependent dehydrogenase (short-subunit alcohol dehydrogenase family)
MRPEPVSILPDYRGSGKLDGKVALVTGGDSGIGRAVALHFAREGANIAVVYLEETSDAEQTRQGVEQEGRKCVLIKGDLGKENFSQRAVEKCVKDLGGLDILVNNAAEQHPQEDFENINEKQLLATFRTNILGMFFLTRAALPQLRKREGAAIINTTSVTAYRGSPTLVDYSSTKGAIVSFTRSLSLLLAKDNIRVNAVAPGPIWTPLIPSTFPPERVEKFGADTPLGRPGEPWEVATCYVFLASRGRLLHHRPGPTPQRRRNHQRVGFLVKRWTSEVPPRITTATRLNIVAQGWSR